MIERLAIVALVVALVIGGVILARWLTRRRLRNLQRAPGIELLEALGVEPDGRAVVVAFSSPGCAACRTAQAPALRILQQRFADRVRVLPIDLSRRPEVAGIFGILTVPSTVVLQPDGQVLAANHGFAPLPTLTEQVGQAVSPPTSSLPTVTGATSA